MAENNDEDLVSQVKVEGTEESAAQIEQFADRGAAAFDKLNDAATKNTNKAADALDKMRQSTKDVADEAQKFNKIQLGPGVLKDIDNLKKGLSGFVSSLGRTGQAVGRFAGRLALIGSAAQAAAVGFVIGAEKIAKAADGTNDALKQQTQAQIDANNAAGSSEQAQIQLASSQRQLFQQLQTGKISYQDYNKAIQESNAQYKEQQRVAAEVANAQARVKEENDRLQKSLANREAMNKLIDTFGGPLTSSLIAFGRQAEAARKSFLDSFGPGLASLVDAIGQAFSKNAGSIDAFFQRMGTQLQQFVSQNGPALQLALENIGAAGAAIFEGILKAGPPLLDFFNNQLVPAFRAIGSFFDGLADMINQAFGTQVTGGFLILIGLMLQLSGGLRLLFALVRTGIPLIKALWAAFQLLTGGFSPFGIALKIVLALLVLLITQVDWSSWGAAATAAFAVITTGFSNLAASATQFIENTKREFDSLLKALTDFPKNVVIIFNAAWDAVTTSFNEMVENTKREFDALVKFFSDFPTNLKIIWDAIGQGLMDAFNFAVNTVKTYLRDLAKSAMEYLQPILDIINAIGGGTANFGAGGSTAPAFAGGGKVRGPGTETSDSIWARLSNNEFVMRAKAVRKYGVGLMNSINEGRFRVPKFNLGGLNVIGPSLPRSNFADGGPVNSPAGLRPLSLSILGETFSGLLAPEDVAGRLSRFAVARNARSAGNKPSWVR